MTAHVIEFPRQSHQPHNEAHAAFILIAEQFPNTKGADAELWADYMLMELWALGFKVVPLEDRDMDS